jgi:hypothetical protein
MKIKLNNPPRKFKVGTVKEVTLSDCASIELDSDEQVTFKTKSGSEYDVVKKDFGYYATPSLNGRLLRFKLRAVLVQNTKDQFFVLLVEEGKEKLFKQYCDERNLVVVVWLDDSANFKKLIDLVKVN